MRRTLRKWVKNHPFLSGLWRIISSVMILVSFTDRDTRQGHLRSCEVISSLLPINHDTMVLKTCKRYQLLVWSRRVVWHAKWLSSPPPTGSWPDLDLMSSLNDLWKSSCTCFESSRREKHNDANPLSLSFLVQKWYKLKFPRHFILMTSGDLNIDLTRKNYVKVVDLWQIYPTPFAACQSDACFFRFDGGGGRIGPLRPESNLSEPARNRVKHRSESRSGHNVSHFAHNEVCIHAMWHVFKGVF